MISLNRIELRFGNRRLLRDITLNIQPGECIAVVGPNGCGKSTLLKVIAGIEKPDSGEIAVPNRTTLGYLPQEANLHVDHPLGEELLSAFDELRAAMREMTALETEIGQTAPGTPEHERALARYADCAHFVEHHQGYAMEAQVRQVASGLGFSPDDLKRSCREFSGGWQMRILLARLLLRGPDVLLLDEPTNHLDLESTLWLEQWIKTCGRTVVMVSHERATMDRLAARIVCMEQGTADVYPGSYSNYLKLSEQKRQAQWEAYQRQQKEIEAMEAFIRRFRYNASKAALVQSRIKQLEKIERLEQPFHPTAIHFAFPPAPPSYQEVVRLEGLGHAYGSHRVLRDITLTIHRGEKIGLVGVNGAGKSTLLRILARKEEPSEGRYTLGERVQMGYFAQYDTSTLEADTTLLEAIEASAPVGQATRARDLLGAFLFTGDDALKPLRALSGGERTRFRLARMLFSPANLLLLDEPTNHLDVTSRATVEQALQHYTGTVVVVSHDRVFMERVTNRILEIENGTIRSYPGNYGDYLAYKQKILAEQTGVEIAGQALSGQQPKTADPESSAKQQRIQDYEQRKARQRAIERLRKHIDQFEEAISENEDRQKEIEREMASPAVAADYTRLAPLTEQRRQLLREHQELFEQWESLHGEMEEMQTE